MIDTRKKIGIQEQATPFNQDTIIVIHITLFIYSYVTNVFREIRWEKYLLTATITCVDNFQLLSLSTIPMLDVKNKVTSIFIYSSQDEII